MFLTTKLLNLLLPKHNLYYDCIDTYLPTTRLKECWQPKNTHSTSECTMYSLLNYHHPNIEELLHRAKFHGELAILTEVVSIFEYARVQLNLALPELITFVPADPHRWRQRQYHVPQILAYQLGQHWQIPSQPLLVKKKHTESQVTLTQTERYRNLESVFSPVNLESGTYPTNIWLVDDIITTGTTLRTCWETLHRALPHTHILGVVLAG